MTACTVHGASSHGKLSFLPPFAHLNATIFLSMHGSGPDPATGILSSYSNFRFYSESMLAQVLPSEVERSWLELHNARGGRLGGANRFMDHLDDMPSAGWEFGALVQNKTSDFLALLYGHAATYQSRGSFHSTEQLSFEGSGRYRKFDNIPDPPPFDDGVVAAAAAAATESSSVGATAAAQTTYNGLENDVSFCIVSNILVARMTRWQLIMEDKRTASIWLGRGAPLRWFRDDGFSVSRAPTSVGAVDYVLEVLPPLDECVRARYNITLDSLPLAQKWTARWPGAIVAGSVQCVGCTVLATDVSSGVVTVKADGGGSNGGARFSIQSTFSKPDDNSSPGSVKLPASKTDDDCSRLVSEPRTRFLLLDKHVRGGSQRKSCRLGRRPIDKDQ